jgi:hypothetical protein
MKFVSLFPEVLSFSVTRTLSLPGFEAGIYDNLKKFAEKYTV